MKKLSRGFSLVREILHLPEKVDDLTERVQDLTDLIILHQTKQLQSDHPNPLNNFGSKCFSQTDEDGITLEILKRIGKLSSGVYAEFGPGDGTENNTLILTALGWKGFWVGGQDLRFSISSKNRRFRFLKEWITLENISDLARRGLSFLDSRELDVISLDLDGNDIHFAADLLSNGFRPKLFIVEYNAKFPPPIEFKITYDPAHRWKNDDYFGASLSSFNKLFDSFGYKLICCNSHTGSNAFFIDEVYADMFSDVPNDIDKIYVGPRYFLYHKYGHRPSVKTIVNIFNEH